MRLRTVLKIVAVLVIAVVVAIAAILFAIDPNDYKPEIAAEARKATGRELVLGGDIALQVGLRPRLVIADAALSNADWGLRPEMLRVGRFEVQVALFPLIRGELVIDELILRDADILLETDAQGRGNWEFGAAPAATATDAAPATPRAAPTAPDLKAVTIERGKVVYRDGATGTERSLELSNLRLAEPNDGAPMDLALDLVFDDLPVHAEGTIGSLKTFGKVPFALNLAVQALGLDATLGGSIADPLAGRGIALNVAVTGETLAGLAPLVTLPDAGPLKLSAAVNGSPETLALDDLALTLGDSDLTGSLGFDGSGARPKLSADLTSQKLDLTQFMAASEPEESGAAAEPAKAPATADDRVFPDDPLPLDGLAAADAEVTLKAAALIVPGATLSDVAVTLALANGRVAIDPLGLAFANSRLDGTLTLDAGAAPPALDLNLQAPALDLGAILAEQGLGKIFEGAGKLDLVVSGRGASVAALVGSLNGHSRFLMDEGRFRTKGLDLIADGLADAAESLFGADKEWVLVNCIAEDIAFKDGLATVNAGVLDTDVVTVFAEGTLDLKTEQLKLKLSPNAKSQTFSVAIPVNVRGTLATPTFALDELAAAQRLGGALGAFIFPPAAIADFANMGGGDNPCLKVSASGGDAAPQPAGESEKGSREKAEDALEDLTKGLKSLFGD